VIRTLYASEKLGMFKAKPVNIEHVRMVFKLDDNGYLIDHVGNPAQVISISGNRYVETAFGDRIAYRRAVWACVHDAVPERIFKIDRDADESLSNLSDKSAGKSKFPARLTVNNKVISLGYYPTRLKACEAVQEYKEHGAIVSVRFDTDGYTVYERRGRVTRKVFPPFETKYIADIVAMYYGKCGLRVPALVTDGKEGRSLGYHSNALKAFEAAKNWIAHNPDQPFNQPYDYFNYANKPQF